MSREVNIFELLGYYGHDQRFMNLLGINLRLWLDKSPMENYRDSRGI
jgi:hypothetical protein